MSRSADANYQPPTVLSRVAVQSLSGQKGTSPVSICREESAHARQWYRNWSYEVCDHGDHQSDAENVPLIFLPRRLAKKRKEESFESDSSALSGEPDHGLSDGFAKLGYMTGHDFFALAKPGADVGSGIRSVLADP